jgi:DegV family protein with EDD domain
VVLPLGIHTADADLVDGPAVRERVLEAIARGEQVKTSPPTPGDFLLAIEACGAKDVLVLTPAAEFTVLHRNAELAARHASVDVEVVDVRAAAGAHHLVAREVMGAIRAGAGARDAAVTARRAADRAEFVATVDSLKHLVSTGHVPSPTLTVAGQPGIQPVFRLVDGRVETLAAPRDEVHAVRQLVEHWRADGGTAAGTTVVMHSGRRDDANDLAKELDGDVRVLAFSPAMTVHTGPGVLGLAWLRQPGDATDHHGPGTASPLGRPR